MHIENLDALKTWLSKTLVGICDADPETLAKYVLALVKKDKPEEELLDLCNDQLGVFLSEKTPGFVKLVFDALKSKSYMATGNGTPAAVTHETKSNSQPPSKPPVPSVPKNEAVPPSKQEGGKKSSHSDERSRSQASSDDSRRRRTRTRSRSPDRPRDLRAGDKRPATAIYQESGNQRPDASPQGKKPKPSTTQGAVLNTTDVIA